MNAEKKEHYVKGVFGNIASSYDRMNLIMTWGLLPLWQKIVMRKAQLKPGESALDVCCGTGEMTRKLAKETGPFGDVYGLDFSAEMLAVAVEKTAAAKMSNISYITGDALALPYAGERFQAVTSGFALRNVTDIKKAISEMARVTLPGGKVVIIEVSEPIFPLFRWFFKIYYYQIVPILGRVLAGQEEVVDGIYEPYHWLAESLRDFPDRKTIKAYLKEARLENVKARPVGFGATTIYWGTKKHPTIQYQTPQQGMIEKIIRYPLTVRDFGIVVWRKLKQKSS